MAKMWMIRGESGRLYDDFRERKVAAIGWSQLAAVAKPNMTRKELTALYQGMEPNINPARPSLVPHRFGASSMKSSLRIGSLPILLPTGPT